MGIQILPSLIVALAVCYFHGVHSAQLTIKNNCTFQIWPAAQTQAGAPVPTGFALAPQASTSLTAHAPWFGKFWARTQCISTSGKFTCLIGDCNSTKIECNGAGPKPPATLVEIALAGAARNDLYAISLSDGFNLPVSVRPDRPNCTTNVSCAANINRTCPNELAVKDPNGSAIIGCKSACAAFDQPQYCCTGKYNTPWACKPTNYSEFFKKQCPQAYSYVYDSYSRFLCKTGGNFLITFCP